MAKWSLRTMKAICSFAAYKFFTFPINYTGESNSHARKTFSAPRPSPHHVGHIFLFSFVYFLQHTHSRCLCVCMYMCGWHYVTLTFVLFSSIVGVLGPTTKLRMCVCNVLRSRGGKNDSGNHVKIHRNFLSSSFAPFSHPFLSVFFFHPFDLLCCSFIQLPSPSLVETLGLFFFLCVLLAFIHDDNIVTPLLLHLVTVALNQFPSIFPTVCFHVVRIVIDKHTAKHTVRTMYHTAHIYTCGCSVFEIQSDQMTHGKNSFHNFCTYFSHKNES